MDHKIETPRTRSQVRKCLSGKEKPEQAGREEALRGNQHSDSACMQFCGMQCALPEKTNSSSRFISLGRRQNQKRAVAAREALGSSQAKDPVQDCLGQPG